MITRDQALALNQIEEFIREANRELARPNQSDSRAIPLLAKALYKLTLVVRTMAK